MSDSRTTRRLTLDRLSYVATAVLAFDANQLADAIESNDGTMTGKEVLAVIDAINALAEAARKVEIARQLVSK